MYSWSDAAFAIWLTILEVACFNRCIYIWDKPYMPSTTLLCEGIKIIVPSLIKHFFIQMIIFLFIHENECCEYRIYHMYSERQVWANSLDQDAATECGVSSKSTIIQQFVETTSDCKLYLFKFKKNFKTSRVRSWGVWIPRVYTYTSKRLAKIA